MLDRHTALRVLGAFALVLLLGWPGAADARQFKMTGKWTMQRGPNVQIPLCILTPYPIATKCNVYGGGKVNATGSNPATLTVPPNIFQRPAYTVKIPLPQPTLVQLTTAFTMKGGCADTAATTIGGCVNPGVLKKSAWTATRSYKSFAFCPGATANPSCTTHQTGPTQGTRHGIIRYTAGSNAFGGTYWMMLGGVGELAQVVATSPYMVEHQPMGAQGMQEDGMPYAMTTKDIIPKGPITQSPVLSPWGLVQTPGPTVGYGTTMTNTKTGMPWTTGQVYVHLTILTPTLTTFTATGSDARTALGAGNITMVAGSLVFRKKSGMSYGSLGTLSMQMSTRTPSMSPAGFAAAAVLMVLAVGYALRRRF